MSAASVIFSVVIFIILMAFPTLMTQIMWSYGSIPAANAWQEVFSTIGWYWYLVAIAVSIMVYMVVSKTYG